MDKSETISKIKRIGGCINWIVLVMMVGVQGSFLAVPKMNPERNIFYFLVGAFLFLIGLCMLGLMITRIQLSSYLSKLENQE